MYKESGSGRCQLRAKVENPINQRNDNAALGRRYDPRSADKGAEQIGAVNFSVLGMVRRRTVAVMVRTVLMIVVMAG